MSKQIFLITGVMASGKSTVSELLASRLPACVHLRGDVFRKMIRSGRADMTENASAEAVRQLYLRYKLTAEAAKTYYDNGFSVVIQDNYYGEALTDMLLMLKDYPVHAVVLAPGVEAIAARELQRPKKGYIGFSVKTLYEKFISETPHLGLWIDSSHQSPLETVELILEHFRII